MTSGTEAILAAKQAATWATAVAAGATDGLLCTRFAATKKRDRHVDDSAGQPFIRHDDAGAIQVEGSIDAYNRYEGLGVLMALVMGTAGAPSQQAATAAYQHVLELANNTDGKFASLAKYNGYKVEEVGSAKIGEMQIAGEAGQALTVNFKFTGDDVAFNAATGTNNTTTIASVTVPDRGNRVWMKEGALWINDQDGAALASGDAFSIGRFNLRCARPMQGDLVNAQDTILEPTITGHPEIMLELVAPTYNSAVDALLVKLLAGTAQKASLTFTGSLIEDTYYYGQTYEFPNLEPLNYEGMDIARAEKVGPVSLQFRCCDVGSAPTGMSVTKPFQLTLMNQRTTALLS